MEHSLMHLHQDPDAFSEMIQLAAQAFGLRQVYVEKDYWVTKALKHLCESVYANDVVFKGGTSLSKGYHLVKRFSEDIDLAVNAANRSDAALKAQIKSVEKSAAIGLVELPDDARTSKGSKYRRTVYRYPRRVRDNDFGQASSEIVIEVNAFAHPEPHELRPIQTLIAEALLAGGHTDIVAQFGLESFDVNVLSVKRTLVEKMLILIKASYGKDPIELLTKRMRHIYDICLILRLENYRKFVQSQAFLELCEKCITDERSWTFRDAECLDLPLAEAPLFSSFSGWQTSLDRAYRGTFTDLVYGELPSMAEIARTVEFIGRHLKM